MITDKMEKLKNSTKNNLLIVKIVSNEESLFWHQIYKKKIDTSR